MSSDKGEHSTSYTLTRLDGRPANITLLRGSLEGIPARLEPPREEATEVYVKMRQ